MNNLKGFFCFYLCFIFVSVAQSGKISLIDFFNEIEKKHNIQFNYDTAYAETLKITPINVNVSLDELVTYIEKSLPLIITNTNNGVYLVSQGKTFCGFLYDSTTQLPIVNASISSNNKVVITNDEGYFSILSSQTNMTVLVEKEHYISIDIKLISSNCETYFLIPTKQNLDEIVITTYLSKGIDQNKKGNIIIDYDNFKILPGMTNNDVLRTVQNLPGITSVNETVSNINIRGGSHDQNLITWDGIKMYKSGHFFGLISNFNPQITNKTEVIKNGSSPIQTDGVSGSIIMETNTNITKKTKGSVGLDFLNADAFIDLPLSQNSSIQIAGRKAINSFLETPTYTNFFQRISQDTEVSTNSTGVKNSDKTFDFYDVSLRYLLHINESDFLKVNLFNSDNELSFLETNTNNTPLNNNIVESKTSSLQQNNFGASILFHKKISQKVDGTIQIYETDYKLKGINANVLQNQRFLQENIVSETSVKAILNLKNNKNNSLLTGYHFTETEITDLNDIDTPLFRRLLSNVLRTHAIFSNYSKQSKNGKSHLEAGVRINFIPELDIFRIEPRLHYSKKILKNTTFLLSGELKSQTTTQIINFQNDFLGIEKRRWQLSNEDDIPLLKSTQVSSGLQYNKKSWLISAEGYYKTIEGITSQSQGFQTKYEFLKTVGSYRIFGIDALVRYHSKNITSWLGYATMNNKYTFDDLPENTFPSNFNINHNLSYGINYQTNALQIASGIQWRTGNPTTEPIDLAPNVQESIAFNDVNSSELPPYFRWDASILYTINKNKKVKTTLGLSAWNILNTKNIINRYYRKANENIITFNQEALNSTINFSARINF